MRTTTGAPKAEADWVGRAVAFGTRTFSKRPRHGEDLERRAAGYIRKLKSPSRGVSFRVALQNLEREYDLLDEESALVASPLELQLVVIGLMDDETVALRLGKQILCLCPVAKLVSNIIAQAFADRATAVRISFGSVTGHPVKVYYQVHSAWIEKQHLPGTLRRAVRGFLVRAEQAGYAKVRPHLAGKGTLPRNLRFAWPDGQTLDLTFE